MPVWILVVVTAFLIVSEGMFVYMFFKMFEEVQDLKTQYEFCKAMVKINNETCEKILGVLRKHEEQYDRILKESEIQRQCYDIIKNNHELICDNYSKLLNAWKRIEERYDCAYEEYKSCSERLNNLLERPFSSEDEYYLDTNEACDTVCINCTLEKCTEEKCPVRMLQKRLAEGMKGETE